MTAQLVFSDGTVPSSCAAYGVHRPAPLRFIVHHVLPQVCGGLSEPLNEVSVCDSCHMSIHALMYEMRVGGPGVLSHHRGTPGQRSLAHAGYVEAQDAGTVDLIPNEGGSHAG